MSLVAVVLAVAGLSGRLEGRIWGGLAVALFTATLGTFLAIAFLGLAPGQRDVLRRWFLRASLCVLALAAIGVTAVRLAERTVWAKDEIRIRFSSEAFTLASADIAVALEGRAGIESVELSAQPVSSTELVILPLEDVLAQFGLTLADLEAGIRSDLQARGDGAEVHSGENEIRVRGGDAGLLIDAVIQSDTMESPVPLSSFATCQVVRSPDDPQNKSMSEALIRLESRWSYPEARDAVRDYLEQRILAQELHVEGLIYEFR